MKRSMSLALGRGMRLILRTAAAGLLAAAALAPLTAQALPSFARQTGQSCVACHAGGQFPELTPYGRMFKLTGYTLGERSTVPLSAMLVASVTKTAKNTDDTGAIVDPKDGKIIADFASVFFGGKIVDKLGAFAQYTFVNYDHQDAQGGWVGHVGSDNTDIRYADHFVDPQRDWVYGFSLNNNPSVQDVWNSSPAWGYPYVSSIISPVAKIPFAMILEGGLAQQVAGLGGYVYWNKTLYGEVSLYRSASGILSFLRQGNYPGDANHPRTFVRGQNPYWRLAYTREWGPSNFMVGASGFNADVYANDANNQPIFGPLSTKFHDLSLDGQYQYILDPHVFTAQLRWIRESIDDPGNLVLADNTSATLKSLRAKASYIYQFKYGASLSYFNVSGDPDSAAFAGGVNNSPNTQGWTPEVFWMPTQNIRLGLQYTAFTKYLGERSNYTGTGRNASDNNTTYLYFWAAY